MSGGKIGGPRSTPYTSRPDNNTRPPNNDQSNITAAGSIIPRDEDFQNHPETPILDRKAKVASDRPLTESQVEMFVRLQHKDNKAVFESSLLDNVLTMKQLTQLRNALPANINKNFELSLLKQAASLSLNDAVSTLLDLNLPPKEYYNVLAVYMRAPNQVHCPVRTVMSVRAEDFAEKLSFENADLVPLINDMTLRALSFINIEMKNVAQDLLLTSHLTAKDQTALKHQLQQQHNDLAEAIEARS